MKKSLVLFASTVCLGALADSATPGQGFGETYPDFQPKVQSPLTRAAVEADLRAARKAGTIVSDGDGYDQSASLIQSPMQHQAMETEAMHTRPSGTSAPDTRGGYEMSAPSQTPR